MADLAGVVARFTGALHAAGMPVGPDRAERFARAVTVARPRTLTQLRACAHATLALTHDDDRILDQVFDSVFEDSAGAFSTAEVDRSGSGARDIAVPMLGSELEQLRHREFGELTTAELLELADAMAALRLATPVRHSRRTRKGNGRKADLRATLRLAHRSAGEPLRLVWLRRRDRPRRLVVLCDISGSMEPYARAMLLLLYCAKSASKAEVFTFATQLTRLTPSLSAASPALALAAAGAAAPDWSSGTRIGAAVQEFLDRFGRRGLARGAVVLIISDGWETGSPSLLGTAMRRLSLVAYRIVWANPRTHSPGYRPLVGGMAAAWPYCDAVVSAHDLGALDDLLSALASRRDTDHAAGQ